MNLQKRLKELEAENKRLKSNKKSLTLQVSKKGCVQLNGLRRFPVSYYAEEWYALFEMEDEIKAFIKENKKELKFKAKKKDDEDEEEEDE
jgi:hypothetical protein